MTVTVDSPDVALDALKAKPSDEAADCPCPAAVMKLYALGPPFVSVVAESAGNGRVEFMDRLAKRGGVFGQTPEGLVQRLAFRPSLHS
jgi:hypothetical protein